MMLRKYKSNVNFAIYDKGKLTEIVQPDHIGLIGIHAKKSNHVYPKNKVLEICVIGPNKICQDEYRVPVIVSLSDDNGLALRLEEFNADKVKQWSKILNEVYSV